MENDIFDLLNTNIPEDFQIVDRNYLVKKAMDGEYNIVVDQARYPLENLPSIFSKYNLQPDYQRKRVWDDKRKSRLIESLLVNVPIPPIFLYEIEYNKFEVMDGLQRISTIISFFKDDFKLDGLELWKELNGMTFSDLPEELQNSINRRYLSGIIILKESNKAPEKEAELKKFIFERLNTGGMELSPHEIRNALYSSGFNEMINSVSEYDKFKSMISNTSDELIRMEDRELILRFFAYKSAIQCSLRKTSKFVLDLFSKKAVELKDNQVEEAEEYFISIVDLVNSWFGEKAFKKSSKAKFEKMIFDTIMLATAKLVDEIDLEDLIKIGYSDDSERKYKFFKENKGDFNGKYTALSNVEKRVDMFYEFMVGELKLD